MHSLNTPQIIAHELFGKGSGLNQLRMDFLYNKIYGVIPTTLRWNEYFELSCMEVIKQNFDTLYSEMTSVGDKILEDAVWVGKIGTPFEDIFLRLSQGGSDGIQTYEGSRIGPTLSDVLAEKKKIDLYVSASAVLRDNSKAQVLIDLLKPHKFEQKGKIYMLASSYGDLTFDALPLPDLDTNLALNYGEEFPKFHEELVDSINDKSSGLYLFYGPPGTGKSSYIKHLLTGEIKRKMAYIPVSMINQLVSPEMLPLLMDNKGIVLVLEDAEKALVSRDIAENSAIVSTILNLTDGFIGQALNITVIATFNTAKEKIDEALLRKGRLRMSYEFNKLSINDSKTLARSLKIDPAKIKEEMSLADIYNFEEDTGYAEPEEKRLGFR